MKKKTTIIIEIDVTGSGAAALDVVNRLLDAGTIQDEIDSYAHDAGADKFNIVRATARSIESKR